MKILWVKSELLHPIDKGGRIRTYQVLRQLKKDHHITYLCLSASTDPQESFEKASEYCHRLLTAPWREPAKGTREFFLDLARNLVDPLPYVQAKYRSEIMRGHVSRLAAAGELDVVISDFLTPSQNVPADLPCPTVLFQHNIETVLWERLYQNQESLPRRAYFYGQYLKMRRFEGQECRRYDAVATVSTNDSDALRRLHGIHDVFDVPTGVDTDYFSPGSAARDPDELVFTGSMDWMPNEDAMLFFAEKILPLVERAAPAVKVTVVGRNPTEKVVALARENKRFSLTGWVEDVRPYIDRGAVYIVPLRVGGGTRIKIYEAMAMARAVVSTTIGAEGLPVKDGDEIVLADEPQAFADGVVRLLRDREARARIESAARKAVVERFGWDKAAEALLGACKHAMERHRSGR
jgi:glycosyltransferase involved in cell wall biosynthesis